MGKDQIEIEKKFQPSEEQLSKLIEGGEYMGEKNVQDFYYDNETYGFAKSGMFLRARDGKFELKACIKEGGKFNADQAEEIVNESIILERLGFSASEKLEDIVNNKLQILCDIITNRKKYKKEEFTIDIDETNFGYNVTEIELVIDPSSNKQLANEKIIKFAQRFALEEKELILKPLEYLKKKKPEIFAEIMKVAENNRELNKLK